MSTNPIKPSDQADGAWQPTVDTSAKDASDQKQAAEQYDQIYGGTYSTSAPSSDGSDDAGPGGRAWNLSTAYTTAPDIIPVQPSQGTSGGSTDRLFDQFHVNLGVVRSTEQNFLSATGNIVDAYTTLSSTVQSAASSDSIFGQQVSEGGGTPSRAGGPVFVKDDLDQEGQDFAASVDPQMKQLLAACSGVIESMGQFNALLNNAAQMYADADASSAYPPPDKV